MAHWPTLVPQRHDHPWYLEEGHVVGLVVHAPIQAPAERLAECLGARDVADAEADEAGNPVRRLGRFLVGDVAITGRSPAIDDGSSPARV
jgi:hypothetical protein